MGSSVGAGGGGHGRTVAFMTLGCKVNHADSDCLARVFAARGFRVLGADSDAPADVYVVNTCTVTALADSKSRQAIRRAVRLNPYAVVAATGCLAQTAAGELARGIAGLQVVVGNSAKGDLVHLVEHALSEGTGGSSGAVAISAPDFAPEAPYDEFDEFHSPAPKRALGRTRATVKIQDGCDQFCTYCRVPYARGPVRSRDLGRVISEVEGLVGLGYREIVLAGVHLGHYGRDCGGLRLSDAVRSVAEVAGVLRVRTSSVDPTDVTPALIELVAGHPRVCRHLHVPLQGTHNAVLKAMNRRYTREEYAGLIATLRAACPAVAISTDVIAGFPGETDAQAADGRRFVSDMSFSRLHVFPFSPRAGTAASSMEGQIEPSIRASRAAQLSALGRELSMSYHRGLVGTTAAVLTERAHRQPDKARPAILGHTDTYVRVGLVATACGPPFRPLANTLARVVIVGYDADGAWGNLLQECSDG